MAEFFMLRSRTVTNYIFVTEELTMATARQTVINRSKLAVLLNQYLYSKINCNYILYS